MTIEELKKAINDEVSRYLGFTSELAGLSGRSKKQLENCLNKLQEMNNLVSSANQVRAKYMKKQWDVAKTFGYEDAGVTKQDLAYVDNQIRKANNIWCSNLFK